MERSVRAVVYECGTSAAASSARISAYTVATYSVSSGGTTGAWLLARAM